jgi:hypothetical protein
MMTDRLANNLPSCMSPLQRFRWQADTPRATRPSWWYHHTSQSPMASNSGANTPSSSRGRRLLLLHCTLFQGSVVSEVGHRRDNDNHSPSHCVILVQHGHALGADFFIQQRASLLRMMSCKSQSSRSHPRSCSSGGVRLLAESSRGL